MSWHYLVWFLAGVGVALLSILAGLDIWFGKALGVY